MKISLKNITLINFKGIRHFSTTFSQTTNIYGENATGKTSLFDAFTWLLFGKDSSDRKDFEVKTLDENNVVIPEIEHEVNATLVVDGLDVVLKRIFKEKWVKKRGSEAREFGGNETLYFWNDVPMQQKEYQDKINGIVNEGLFKLITNTLYFNQMKWQDRRQVLITLAGNISNEDIFNIITTAKNKAETDNLINVLNGGKSMDEYKKELSSKKKLLTDSLKMVPTRIDEATRSQPDALDFPALEKQKAVVLLNIDDVDRALTNASTALTAQHEETGRKQNDLFDKQSKLRDRQYVLRQQFVDGRRNRESDINNLVSDIRTKQGDVERSKREIDQLQSQVNNLTAKKLRLQEDWHTSNNKQLEFTDDLFVCPTCKQAMDADNIEEKKAEMLENFNSKKSENLSGITTEGKQLKNQIDGLVQNITVLNNSLTALQNELDVLSDRLVQLQAINADLDSNEDRELQSSLAADETIIELNKNIVSLQEEISKGASTAPDNTEILSKKRELQAELEGINRQLATKEQIEKTATRIKELQDEEKNLAQQIASLERTEYHIEQFTKAKMDTLVQRINGRFRFVKFRLFEAQVNGGEAECCDTLINGVPFNDANNAAKINAGLDIINTLCQHHNVYAPIFIDNRESVNQLIDSDSQIVNLIVSTDKKLRVAA